ncbi:MAG: 16S rRNA (cytosine(967)-C(5))-methyltransferase RsmB [Acutalibacteraceae bacterium]|nr:16S rRNA (cytosine(967)-C(5))-methyltransferase RsmB [Acutalibacteraceae bacterium]
MADSRQIAFEALLKTEKQGAYSNITIDSFLTKTKLDTRDKSFVSALFYGVIERKLTIDYQLQLYLDKPIKKLKPEVLSILRMGAYQILFMDKVPASAAVNESVKLTKKNGCSFASGLVNAVLRKVDKGGIILPEEKDYTEYLSIKYSCPQWLVNKWTSEYGSENTEGLLLHSIGVPSIYIRVNTTKINSNKLISILTIEGVNVIPTDIPDAMVIDLCGKDIEKLESFKKGLYHVQDISCQLCSMALSPKKGDTIFDLCSAPGGKAYTVCELMEDTGKIFCFDIHENRVELIKKGAERLGLNSIKAAVSDASVFNNAIGYADKVLCDVPCSGLGIISRKPEIKYKKQKELEDLPELQLRILKNGAKYVKNGGILVYSTCSVSKDENESVCTEFLKSDDSFESIIPLPELSNDKFLTLMPHKFGGDGFFIAAFRKKDEIL